MRNSVSTMTRCCGYVRQQTQVFHATPGMRVIRSCVHWGPTVSSRVLWRFRRNLGNRRKLDIHRRLVVMKFNKHCAPHGTPAMGCCARRRAEKGRAKTPGRLRGEEEWLPIRPSSIARLPGVASATAGEQRPNPHTAFRNRTGTTLPIRLTLGRRSLYAPRPVFCCNSSMRFDA